MQTCHLGTLFRGKTWDRTQQGIVMLERRNAPNGEEPRPLAFFCVFVESQECPGKWGPRRRNSCRKDGALTPGAQLCTLPHPTFLRQNGSFKTTKREDDGREGAISGRLARKATGVSPSGFVRTGVFAGKEGLPISSVKSKSNCNKGMGKCAGGAIRCPKNGV